MGIDSNTCGRSLIASNLYIHSIERSHLIWIWTKHFRSAFSSSTSYVCVRTSTVGDDFHIIVLQEFPLNTLNPPSVCWCVSSHLVSHCHCHVRTIDLTSVFRCFVYSVAVVVAIFAVAVFFYIQSRNVHGRYSGAMYVAAKPKQPFTDFLSFIFFCRPSRTKTHVHNA